MKITSIACAMLVSLFPVSSWAIQQLDDNELAEYTGQDGVTITLLPTGPITADINWHDNDGLNGDIDDAGTVSLGTGQGLGSNSFSISTGNSNINVKVILDAVTDQNGRPILNAQIQTPQNLELNTGDIWVGTANPVNNGARRGFTNGIKVMDTMRILLDKLSVNLQLGNEAQGAMIKLGVNVTDGLRITGWGVKDYVHGGGLYVGRISVANVDPINALGDKGLSLSAKVDINSSGLVVNVDQLGDAKGVNVALRDVRLGNVTKDSDNLLVGGTTVGNVELLGVKASGTTITVSGH